jgi:uncharacterized repeat protein (TIGR01451 family)
MSGDRFSWLLARAVARFVAPLGLAVFVALLPLATYAGTITVDGTTCKLPDAITAANTDAATNGCTAGSGADTLLLTAPIYSLVTGPYDHDGMTATPSVTSTIIISGGVGGAIVERSGVDLYRLFHVGVTGDLRLQNVVVRYGYVYGDGGAIYDLGTLRLLNSDIISNTARDNRGGSLSNLGTAILTNSDIISNSAKSGGGIANGTSTIVQSTLSVTNSDFIANTARSEGGGILNYYKGTATFTNSNFISNTAAYGGGLFNGYLSTATVTNSDFISNTATESGGGIYNTIVGTLTLTDAEIRANIAVTNGGGLYQVDGQTSIVGSRFLDNDAGDSGGALQQAAGYTSIAQSCIVNNSETALNYVGGDAIEAANNWWGAPDGPSDAGPGSGDSVSSNVNFSPFLTSAILGCPLQTAATFSKSASPSGDLLPGEPLTYTITITNDGATDFNGIYIADTLPADFDLLSTNTTGPSISVNGSSFVITELLESQVATINLVGQVDGVLNDDVLLSNTATLTNALTGVLTATASNQVLVPVLGWSQDAYETNEDSGAFTATVTVLPTNPYISVTVQVVITGSVNAGVAAAMQEVTFPPGSSSQPVVVTVVNDGAVAPRTIQMVLQAPSGASLGDGSSANATLTVTEGAQSASIYLPKVQR